MATQTKFTSLKNATVFDELFIIKAEIADLEAAAKILTNEIKAYGEGAYEGEIARVVVSTVAPGLSLDAAAAEAKLRELGVDNRWFSKHQKTRAGYSTVKCFARKGG